MPKPHEWGPFNVTNWGTDGSAISVTDLLAEPAKEHAAWTSACHARLVLMSTMPLALTPVQPSARERLEAAGLLVVAADADLDEARRHCWPAHAALRRIGVGWGSARPSLVIVGDRSAAAVKLPWASQAGWWLLRALRHMGHDEMTLYLTNAYDYRGNRQAQALTKLHEAFASSEPTWVALGKPARTTLEACKIPHRAINHPNYHRNSGRKKDGPQDYARMLMEGGVPDGPWLGEVLPSSTDILPELPPPFKAEPGWVKGKGGRKQGRAPMRDAALIERARRKYVTGEEKTPGAAARAVGTSEAAVRWVAREEDWYTERQDHAKRKTDHVLDADIRAEVQQGLAAKKLALKATRMSLESLVKQLEKNEKDKGDGKTKPPSFRDAKAISEIYIALRRAGVGDQEDDNDGLSGKNLEEIRDMVTEHLNKMGGE